MHLSLNNIAAREASWRHTNSVTYKKIQIVSMYFKHLFDIKQEVFVGHTLAQQALATHSNLMIVPCFDLPLGAYQFNLSGLSHYELQNFFPDGTTGIFEKYTELRSGHLSDENNHVLADLINQNLKPGIFQADYLQFKSPTVPLETLLAKK